MKRKKIYGPTFEEMLNPSLIPENLRKRALEMKDKDPLDPINLFNISWKDENNNIRYYVMPKEFTKVKANIVLLYAKDFPTGSHKVGATYSILIEKIVDNEVDPEIHTLVWPSTGNYGIGGAWVGCRMNFDSIVILPEEMSKERFDLIEYYGARVIKTFGCESNVKEIYDECKRLKSENPEKIRILNQFEEWGNYHFHYYVTGNTVLEVINELKEKGIGKGKCTACVSAMGSAGTIAFAERVKQVFPKSLTIGVEPIQCPTVSLNGYGAHDIQGIGDKHVTWIHNVMSTDTMMCIDDMESKMGLQLLTDPVGKEFLLSELKLKEEDVEKMAKIFGISGVCNLLAAIKTAKYYDMDEDDVIVTIATDNIDRYHSVMKQLDEKFGKMTKSEAYARYKKIFEGVKLDYVFEGTYLTRKRWHNLKYYTWVEQQGKDIAELNAQLKEEYWLKQQAKIKEYDEKIKTYRDKILKEEKND